MCEALDDHEGSVNIGGQRITNFRFADDIVVNAEEEEEAGILVYRLDTTTTRYKMEIGPDKIKVMTNNRNGFQREIKITVRGKKKWRNSSILEQSSLTKDQNPRFFPEQPRQQQLFLC